MRNDQFNKYAEIYDLFYHDKSYKDEVAYVDKLIKDIDPAISQILEWGCGTGIHGRLLGDMGYFVHGVDSSMDMILKAQTTDNFKCEQGDITELKLNKNYDLIISLFHVVSYQLTNNKLYRLFENAANHLAPGKLFIFDTWFTPAVYNKKPEVRVKRVSNGSKIITRIAEPIVHFDTNTVDVNYTFYSTDIVSGEQFTFSESHTLRHFSIPEIRILSELFGFRLLNYEEFVTQSPVTDNTWGVCFVLQRTS